MKPQHYSWAMPYLTVKDVKKAMHFYHSVFGFTEQEVFENDEGTIIHGEVKHHDAVIMMGKEGAYGDEMKTPKRSGVMCPISMYFYCEDVDSLYEHAIANGAKSIREPEDTFWGDRMATVEDPDGYQWGFGTPMKK